MYERAGGLHILLIEDNTGDAIIFKRAFQRANPETVIVVMGSAEAGLSALGSGELASAHAPDLIVTDINLPGMNGISLLSTIRRSLSFDTVPVVVLSSSEAPEDISASYANLANAYVVKPIDLGQYDRLAQGLSCWVQNTFGAVNDSSLRLQ